jgi:hypothetical protein
MLEDEISQIYLLEATTEQLILDKEPNEPTPEYHPPEQYEDRILAFLDILGFKALVEHSEKDAKTFKRLWCALMQIRHRADMVNMYFKSEEFPSLSWKWHSKIDPF